MRGLRASVIPKQDSHESEALASASRAQERSRKAATPSDDGDSRELSITIPAVTAKTIAHGLGRKPRGWVMLNGSTLSAPLVFDTASQRNKTTMRFTNPHATVAAVLTIKVY